MAYPKQPVDHARLSVDEDLNRIRFSAAGTSLVPVLALVLGEPALVRVGLGLGLGLGLAQNAEPNCLASSTVLVGMADLDQLRQHGVRRALAKRRRRRREGRGTYRHVYSARTVVPTRGKLPCASGTYSTQEAGKRSPYVQYGGPRMYVSAQRGTDHESYALVLVVPDSGGRL